MGQYGVYGGKRQRLLTVLDVGTSKVCCLIARAVPNPDWLAEHGHPMQFKVLGHGLQRSEGIKSGMVVQMDAAERAIRAAVDQAERAAHLTIEDVLLTVTCGRVRSDNFSASVAIKGEAVGQDDVERVLAAGRDYASRDGRLVLHTLANGYRLDESAGVRDPRGMIADRLSLDIHSVVADEVPLKNLVLCVERCHLDVAGLAAAAYASGVATIVRDEAKLGVACIDLGAGTTTIAVFANGQFVYADSLAIGGARVTRDLARTLSMPLDEAERIKTLHASVFATPSDERELVTFATVGEDAEPQFNQIAKAQIAEIVRPRVEELFEFIRDRLRAANVADVQRVVLTGGASLLTGLPELASRVLGMRVRRGSPRRFPGLPDCVGPSLAASIGLMMQSDRVMAEFGSLAPRRRLATGTGYLARVGQWIRESF